MTGPAAMALPPEQRARELAAALEGAAGWQPVTVAVDGEPARVWFRDAVVAEYHPGPGRPGGTVIGTGGSRCWWWTAHDGRGNPLGGNLDGLSLDTAADAVAAVLQAIDFPAQPAAPPPQP